MKILSLYLIFFLIIIQISLSMKINNIILSNNSWIIIKINQTGVHKIISESFKQMPNEIYINGINQSPIQSHYNLNESINYIKLLWNNELDSCCDKMFSQCANITEIDLSNFDKYKVTSMAGMFCNCHSLKSLNLSNFNTSQVTSMAGMFYNCSNLKSLNLLNFDACQVTSMAGMFYNCSNLKYLNIKNFNNKNILYDNMFDSTPENLVICLGETDINKLLNQKKCFQNDCSNDWRKIIEKINNDNNDCIKNCTSVNKYDYNTKCYNDCSTFNDFLPIIKNNENYCGKICQKETPFLILYENECTHDCIINDILDLKCILSYNLTDSEDVMLNYTLKYFKNNNFPKENIKNGENITFKEGRVTYTISILNPEELNNNDSLCINSSSNFYNDIYSNNLFYLLNISIYLEE